MGPADTHDGAASGRPAPGRPLAGPDLWLGRAERLLLGIARIALLILLGMVVVQVTARFAFNSPAGEIVAITEAYIMPLMVFLALAYVQTVDGHVRVIVLYRLASGRAKHALDAVIALLSMGFWALVAYTGWSEVVFAQSLGYEVSHEIRLPLATALIIVPVGAGALSLRLLLSAVQDVLALVSPARAGDAHA
ncbi:MAG: TRAP transporter small permease [Alphaproteobacteria bacterium]|nr:TRAP transporter small permease [Alphaproteobacteria bacterium]MDX5369651.1 TRAP transporter small permease [Alphaproteobacteria bacterium]MDX5464286.1 TRAP transporter small permease [Alphaproteobacteria bacterium]